MSTEVFLNEFAEISEHPYRILSQYKKEGKKVIGVLPYYAPAELVVAAGMVPMGIWGSNKKTIAHAKEYCATFYCTIAQLALEMLLDGTVDIVLARYERKREPLEYRLFAKNKLVLLCAQDTALARKYPSGSSISLRDAQGEAFVLLEKEHHIGQFVREQFVQYGMKVKVLAEVNSFDTAKRIALSSGAVTLSPYPLFSTDPDLERQGNVYFLKNMKSSHHSYLCWRKNMYQTRYMRDWIALLEEGAQQ